MTIRSVDLDTEQLTLTAVADFPVPVHRLWDAYVDPRQLEKFWGPPTWPATLTQHDFRSGGQSAYHLTGPNGEQVFGYWQFSSVDPPYEFDMVAGVAHADGAPKTQLPATRAMYVFEETTLGSLLTVTSYFTTVDEMQQLLSMGMHEDTRAAMDQIEAVITDDSTYAAGHITQLHYLTDTIIRVSRVIRAPIELVWTAFHTPELVRQWMLGPAGWIMTACKLAQRVGGSYRYVWATEDSTDEFGFTGQLLALDEPYHFVTTETMLGVEGPTTTNEVNLATVSEGTLVTTLIQYPTAELRDLVIDTGMISGMENSYSRLESQIVAS